LKITVIIPTYNEAENLPRLVAALFALPLDLSILVIDDNSPDGTGRIADELAKTHPDQVIAVHRKGKFGLSTAYLQAFTHCFTSKVDAIAQMDCDFSHDPKVLTKMAEQLETSDLVLGSRYVPGGSTDVRWPAWRKALSAFGNFYARSILRIPIRDVTTGYRLWRKAALQSLPLERVKSTGYVFMVEMAYLAYSQGLRISEVPIYFADRRWGKSKMSFRIQVEAAVRVWQVLWAYRDLRRKKTPSRANQSL
jgi:dolichol-phosphate mannosyltransferase